MYWYFTTFMQMSVQGSLIRVYQKERDPEARLTKFGFIPSLAYTAMLPLSLCQLFMVLT
jgi:hypothetical protein